jgi:hypothetical protein
MESDEAFVERMGQIVTYRPDLLQNVDRLRLFALARRGAAAGDMLEALKKFIEAQEAADEEDDVPAMLIYGEAVEAIRAAILKAEAQEPSNG